MSQVIGKIIVIGKTQVVGSAGTFQKRLVVVETDEKYAQKIPVDFVQDKCEVLDSYSIGDNVTIDINIRGNEYQDRYYVSLNGWKITKNESTNAPNMETHTAQVIEEDSDLPF